MFFFSLSLGPLVDEDEGRTGCSFCFAPCCRVRGGVSGTSPEGRLTTPRLHDTALAHSAPEMVGYYTEQQGGLHACLHAVSSCCCWDGTTGWKRASECAGVSAAVIGRVWVGGGHAAWVEGGGPH